MSKRWINEKVRTGVRNILHDNLPSTSQVEFDQTCNPPDENNSCNIISDSELIQDNIFSDFFSNDVIEDESYVNESVPHDSKTLAEDLFYFATLFSISKRGMKYLLDILRKHNIDVPKSVYLLKKSCKTVCVNDFCVNDNFAYLSLFDNVSFAYSKGLLNNLGVRSVNMKLFVNIQIFVDGLPLFRSSQIGLWPILMKFSGVSYPFPVAVYCGIGKPKLEVFLKNLIEELKLFSQNGFLLNDGHTIFLGEVVFICDALARCFLKYIKSFTGYYGCGSCRQKGKYVEDRIVFPAIEFEMMKSTDIVEKTTKFLCLLLLPLYRCLHHSLPNICIQFVLGVVRKLFHCYFSASKGLRLPCRLSNKQMTELNGLISTIKLSFPSAFQRKPRPLSELSYFKASEFRTYLLYLGPYILKKFLVPAYYQHFLKLHFAISVFTSHNFKSMYEHASQCLKIFVYDMRELFGERSMVYNIHALLHLPHYVSIYGPLDSFSAFPYESYFSLPKKRIKASNCIFKQSVNQLIQLRSLYSNEPPLTLNFSCTKPNNCCITCNGDVVLLTDAIAPDFKGHLLNLHEPLYSHPYKSTSLNIGIYKMGRKRVSNYIPVRKAVCIPDGDYFVVIPFLL